MKDDTPGRPTAHALLADGTTVGIRPAGPADHDRIRALYDAKSPENLRLRFFTAGRGSAEAASERDIPPVPGAKRAMDRVDAEGHITFGGCLLEGAGGRVARMILRSGKGGDFRDFAQIEEWAGSVAGDLTADGVTR